MIIIKSKNNIPIRLTKERWKHIGIRHPELKSQKDRVLETVANPDKIQQGDYGELISIRFYKKTPLTSKYLAVVYKEVMNIDGFIITAYFTTNPSERRLILWRQ